MRTLIENEDGRVTLEWHDELKIWIVHLALSCWSLEKYKEYLTIWGQLLKQLNSEGIEALYACAPQDDKRKKLMEMFGLTELGVVEGKSIMRIKT